MRYEKTSLYVASSVSLLIACTFGALACGAPEDEQLGQLELGLTSEADGVSYRLSNARFTLDGPERREIAAADEDELTLELPSGAYRLTLLDGFQLVRSDAAAGAPPVAAMLVSQNPAPVLITTGQTARVTLRFALADGTRVDTGRGTLAVSIAVGAADASAERAECSGGLRINELDYEQESSDEAEFVEIVQTGSCPAALTDVTLELVNGNDGRPYGRYALADAAATLAPGERLVVGDANVLAALPAAIKRLMLSGSGLQNGPDGARLVRGEQVIDAVSYGAIVSGSSEGGATAADEGGLALSRCPDGFDTQDGALDFRLAPPTPGAASACSEPPVAP